MSYKSRCSSILVLKHAGKTIIKLFTGILLGGILAVLNIISLAFLQDEGHLLTECWNYIPILFFIPVHPLIYYLFKKSNWKQTFIFAEMIVLWLNIYFVASYFFLLSTQFDTAIHAIYSVMYYISVFSSLTFPLYFGIRLAATAGKRVLIATLPVCLFVSLFAFSRLYFNVSTAGLIQVITDRAYSVHDNEPDKLNYVIGTGERVMQCDLFDPDPCIVYNVPNGCFVSYIDSNENKVLNRLEHIAVEDKDNNPCEMPDGMNGIFSQIACLEHDLMTIRIFDLDGERFVYVEMNVNLITPCSLFYYNKINDRLIKLYTFENRMIQGIHIVSKERLHNLQ